MSVSRFSREIFAAAGLTTAIRRSNVNQELENTYLTILAVFYLDFKEKKRTIPLPHCKRLFCETGELLAKGIGEAKWEGRVVVGRCVGSGVRLSTGLFQPSQSIVSSRIRLAAKSAPCPMRSYKFCRLAVTTPSRDRVPTECLQ
jgi:hypothetical protein